MGVHGGPKPPENDRSKLSEDEPPGCISLLFMYEAVTNNVRHMFRAHGGHIVIMGRGYDHSGFNEG